MSILLGGRGEGGGLTMSILWLTFSQKVVPYYVTDDSDVASTRFLALVILKHVIIINSSRPEPNLNSADVKEYYLLVTSSKLLYILKSWAMI